MEEETQNKHNGVISFWKFAFCILILLFHCEILAQNGEHVLFNAGRIGVEFFFITSGVLMAKSAFKHKENCDNIGKETFQYLWKKIKAFFPYVVVAFIISIFVKKINQKNQIINGVWNLLLLDMSGVKSTSVIGQTWYISAMLISMLILYPLIKKYRKNFTYIMAPLIVIFIGGWISHKYGDIAGPTTWTGFAYKGLLRALFELALGTIVYEISEYMKHINFTKLSKWILTIIEILGFVSIFFICNIENASKKYDFVMILILTISITIAFSEKTILYNFDNNKFFYYLEKLSLPIYLHQIWMIRLISENLSYLSYYSKIEIAVAATIIFSMIIMFITEKVQNKLKEKGVTLKKWFIVKETN